MQVIMPHAGMREAARAPVALARHDCGAQAAARVRSDRLIRRIVDPEAKLTWLEKSEKAQKTFDLLYEAYYQPPKTNVLG
jgi:hypothetical protein